MNAMQMAESKLSLTAGHQYNGFSELLDIATQKEIGFPKGISAFEDYQQFNFRKEPRLKPFIYMHSTVDSNVSFVCVDPFILNPSYQVELPDDSVKRLQLKNAEDLIVLCLVSVGRDMYTTTANLMSPIVINPQTQKGEQVIMENMGMDFLRFNVWNSIGYNSTVIAK